MPKSSSFTSPSARDQDVRRFQVAMHDQVLMRTYTDCRTYLLRQRHASGEYQASARHPMVRDRLTFDVFEGEITACHPRPRRRRATGRYGDGRSPRETSVRAKSRARFVADEIGARTSFRRRAARNRRPRARRGRTLPMPPSPTSRKRRYEPMRPTTRSIVRLHRYADSRARRSRPRRKCRATHAAQQQATGPRAADRYRHRIRQPAKLRVRPGLVAGLTETAP